MNSYQEIFYNKIKINVFIYLYGAREREEIYCTVSIFFAGASTDVFMCACVHVSISFRKSGKFIIYS